MGPAATGWPVFPSPHPSLLVVVRLHLPEAVDEFLGGAVAVDRHLALVVVFVDVDPLAALVGVDLLVLLFGLVLASESHH